MNTYCFNKKIHGSLLVVITAILISAAPVPQAGLFDSDTVIAFTLQGDLTALFNDRGEVPGLHAVSLNMEGEQPLAIQAKVRGHFRKDKSNCSTPPLMLEFPKELPQGSLFSGQKKLKMVTPCQDDRYVVREYLVYRLYNQFSERSFRARLAKVTFTDDRKPDKSRTMYCFLIEDEELMAKRNGSELLERDLIRPENTEKSNFLTMALFELMIANTDWSVQYRQNIKLMSATGQPVYTVPYDFDHSGIVNAPYAKPAEALQMSSVRERRYRGYCIKDLSEFNAAIATFNAKKESVMALYNNNPLIDVKYAEATTKYLGEFYSIINTDKKRAQVLGYPCDETGTGNVVIRGLRKQ